MIDATSMAAKKYGKKRANKGIKENAAGDTKALQQEIRNANNKRIQNSIHAIPESFFMH